MCRQCSVHIFNNRHPIEYIYVYIYMMYAAVWIIVLWRLHWIFHITTINAPVTLILHLPRYVKKRFVPALINFRSSKSVPLSFWWQPPIDQTENTTITFITSQLSGYESIVSVPFSTYRTRTCMRIPTMNAILIDIEWWHCRLYRFVCHVQNSLDENDKSHVYIR